MSPATLQRRAMNDNGDASALCRRKAAKEHSPRFGRMRNSDIVISRNNDAVQAAPA